MLEYETEDGRGNDERIDAFCLHRLESRASRIGLMQWQLRALHGAGHCARGCVANSETDRFRENA